MMVVEKILSLVGTDAHISITVEDDGMQYAFNTKVTEAYLLHDKLAFGYEDTWFAVENISSYKENESEDEYVITKGNRSIIFFIY